MCGIIGIVNYNYELKDFFSKIKELSHRGEDGFGIFLDSCVYRFTDWQDLDLFVSENNSNYSFLAVHLLHSMVNYRPQPLIGEEGFLIANCEIYNWKELAQKYDLVVENDAELLLNLIENYGSSPSKLKKILWQLDGDFAFSYFTDKKVILSRDFVGVKPLFYNHLNDGSLHFASERKILPNKESSTPLYPGEILEYNLNSKQIKTVESDFLTSKNLLEKKTPSKSIDKLELESSLKEKLETAVLKRLPENDVEVGVLFSGGIDSTLIAKILKDNNIDFKCYTSHLTGRNIEEALDYNYALEISKQLGLDLRVEEVNLEELESSIQEITDLLETSNYIKVSVALPLYFSLKKAREDNVKVILSGLGAEELFAGYRRHMRAEDVTKECLEGLQILHDRDLYRDDLVSMKNNIEIRLPFLDLDLIDFSFKIPSEYKINKETNQSKIILREVSEKFGLDKEFAWRKKKAAQYGSKFDKGILRLAKDKNETKQDYLLRFNKNMD